MNLWGLVPEVLGELRPRFDALVAASGGGADSELYLPAVIDGLVRSRRARVTLLRSAGAWCGLTYRADRERAERFIRERIARGDYPRPLWS